MTVLQAMYTELRLKGRRHHHALRELAVRIAVDKPTVERTLKRAEGAERRGRRQ